MSAAVCASARTAIYRRRQPERTLFFRTVQAHLATWLDVCGGVAQGGGSVLACVERRMGRYLECGILADGLARAFHYECQREIPHLLTAARARDTRAEILPQVPLDLSCTTDS